MTNIRDVERQIARMESRAAARPEGAVAHEGSGYSYPHIGRWEPTSADRECRRQVDMQHLRVSAPILAGGGTDRWTRCPIG
jgi:hypothetical protein